MSDFARNIAYKGKAISNLLFLVLFLGGCASEPLQPRLDAIVIEVTGDEFNWYFRYPGRDGLLGTSDDRYSVRNLFLPDKAQVKLKLKSKDYVYSFALPDLGLREVAVPGLDFELQFTTKTEGTMKLLGDQFCGFSHESLMGRVYVRNQNNGFYGW